MFTVHCGTGNQKLRWLSDVALHRYDPECCLDTGLMAEMRFENGVQLSPEGMIADELTDDVHIYLVLLGRYPPHPSSLMRRATIEDLIKQEAEKSKKKKR